MNISGPNAPYVAAMIAGGVAYIVTATDEFQSTQSAMWIVGGFVVIGFAVGCFLRWLDSRRSSQIESSEEVEQ